ncbi:MAG TPA: lytic transglycosylase domain-containing protein [Oscillatoriaceae cyanobacterium]
MQLSDPLRQPQRFVPQADALLRQAAVNPGAPDPFATIDSSLEHSFEAVLAGMHPESTPAATAPQATRAVGGPAAPFETPGELEPLEVSSYDPLGSAFPLSSARGLGVGAAIAHNRYEPLVQQMSARYGVPDWLVRSVMHTESGGNPLATSPVGAMGLMQLMPGTARTLGVQNPYDPAENIAGGTKYLRQLIDTFGNLDEAVAAYNAGPEAVRQYGGVPPYAETQAYVRRVLGNPGR